MMASASSTSARTRTTAQRDPGLVRPMQIDALVEHIHAASGGQSRAATGAAASNLDLYQVNCTFFDAMARDERRYLLARAVQFFLPGIPQVYYVGLLAGHNDMELLDRTGVGRDINRHHYGRAEIEAELAAAGGQGPDRAHPAAQRAPGVPGQVPPARVGRKEPRHALDQGRSLRATRHRNGHGPP